MSNANRYLADEWEQRLEGIDLEIARQAVICKVPLLAHGAVERVLDNDPGVCGTQHPHAFQTLRGLLFLHFVEGRHIAQSLGPELGREIAQQVREHLRLRLGEHFGRDFA